MTEHKILSKVLDENNFHELTKHNITADDFYGLSEVYQFIKEYNDEHYRSPDYRTVVEKFEDFEYEPEVADTMKYLTGTLKASTAKRRAFELIQNQAGEMFNKLNGVQFVNWLNEETSKIKAVTSLEANAGVNYATNGRERLELYKEAEEQGSGMFIPTPYPTLTKWLAGGFELGDYILLQAYTNRGKSWLASQIGLTAWNEGNGVLYYSPELSTTQQQRRFDTIQGHFLHTGLRNGDLETAERARYEKYLEDFNEKNTTPLIVKTMEDLPNGLSVDVINADLMAHPNVSMVVIDGFNLMTHKGYDKTRNNMSGTSRKLRQLFSRHKVAGLVVHQVPTSAEKENREVDEMGAREVVPPRIDQYSETVAVIQDACTILNFDQSDGVGKIRLAKSRVGNVDEILDLHCDFGRGFIKEPAPEFNF